MDVIITLSYSELLGDIAHFWVVRTVPSSFRWLGTFAVAMRLRVALVDQPKNGIFPAIGAQRLCSCFGSGAMVKRTPTDYSRAGSRFRAIGRTRNRRCVR